MNSKTVPSPNALALAKEIACGEWSQGTIEEVAWLIDQHLAGLVRAAEAGDDHWNEEHSKVLRGWQDLPIGGPHPGWQPAAPTDR